MNSDDLLGLIKTSIQKLNNIKYFSYAVIELLDQPERLEKLSQKIRQCEEFLQEKIPMILEHSENIRKLPEPLISKPKLPNPMMIRSTENIIKTIASEIGLPSIANKSKPTLSLTNLKEKYSNLYPFEIKEVRNVVNVQITLKFGISLLFKCSEGRIIGSTFKLAKESLILIQLKNTLEQKWDTLLRTEANSYQPVITKFMQIQEKYKQIFYKKCEACQMHLSFKSGVPMVPLVVVNRNLYHVECFSESF